MANIRIATICLLASSITVAAGEVSIQRVGYHRWPSCYRLTNGKVDLVYVPQIGRIMRFGRVGGPNMLWENSSLAGITSNQSKPGVWANYGGDKLWPAPQSLWGWPPDPAIDGASYKVSIDGTTLVVASETSSKSGVRFKRRITMDSSGTTVHIENAMTTTATHGQELAVWEIAQTDDPDTVVVPIQKTTEMPDGWAAYEDKPVAPGSVEIRGNELIIHRSKTTGFKLGSGSEAGFLQAVKVGETFSMFAEKSIGRYPDGGKFLEIYASADPLKYVELEITGPLTATEPGQTARLDVTWRIDSKTATN
jgi:hypothetical protein